VLAHIAGIPVEEWVMPFFVYVGAALVSKHALFGFVEETQRRTS
jgi:hypothetical protein